MDHKSPDYILHPFTIPPNLTTLPEMTVKTPSTYTYVGPLISLPDLARTFHTWSTATLSKSLAPMLVPFLSYVHELLRKEGYEHYWLSIRATQGTHDSDVPRWHTDKAFFDSAEKNTRQEKVGKQDWKLCTTLLGPGTLFLPHGMRARKGLNRVTKAVRRTPLGRHECRNVRCLGCADIGEEVRKRLITNLKNELVVQAKRGECAILKVGDNGAVHSEPRAWEDRIFVNVVGGTEEGLRGLAARWGMPFPRAWSVGLDLEE